jgi:hypothetical protein
MTIAVVECFTGIGPQAEVKGGVTVALDAKAWQGLKARLPDGHAARNACGGVDFNRSGLVFVRFPADSNTRLSVETASESPKGLTLRLSRSEAVPGLLAVVPAQAWLIVELPRASLKSRPQVSVLIRGEPYDAKTEYLGGGP